MENSLFRSNRIELPRLLLQPDQVAAWLTNRLEKHGLQVEESFNLLQARRGLHAQACPHHAKGPCDCQVIVLMVCSDSMPTETLMLSGCDGHTKISVDQSPGRDHPDLRRLIWHEILTFSTVK